MFNRGGTDQNSSVSSMNVSCCTRDMVGRSGKRRGRRVKVLSGKEARNEKDWGEEGGGGQRGVRYISKES